MRKGVDDALGISNPVASGEALAPSILRSILYKLEFPSYIEGSL